MILLVFLIGVIGTGSELFLLGHYEDAWQWAPLVLLSAGLVIGITIAATQSASMLRIFQGCMILFVLAGFIGLWLHYKGNAEFELEMYPSLKGLQLLWESLTGATPALAPGAMIQLGLIGLLFTYKHPDLNKK